ncbi:protein-export chaperone SecB [Candidatus Pelagibacter sp. HIMB1493]|uniref:protein-export chaperone SecB n=1 Tax=Candidatus Pelagibacter sp. HIMB1493 TaxID=3413334 RepID=UPI003F87CAFA
MTDKFKILGKFIKDMSSETKDTETYVYVKDNILKYQLNIDINSKPLKNKMVEINTILKFEDKENSAHKSYFEMNYATIVKINDEVKEKKDLERIILCDAQIKIYPDLEKSFLNMLHNSGYEGVKLEKKIDFEDLYMKRFN